ncbi:MAG: hypothetical protein EYC62_05830 [Alphaproteobacteria bacterium]|nr:MAG: hypothetical protein EYC62_05830 [Alphaproteobacteria bacterium]
MSANPEMGPLSGDSGQEIYSVADQNPPPIVVRNKTPTLILPAKPSKDLEKLSASKQRKRAFKPFHDTGSNKARDEAERYYRDGKKSFWTGVVSSVVTAGALTAGFLFLATSPWLIAAGLPIFGFFYRQSQKHFRGGDIALLQAPDHIRHDHQTAQKALQRLLQLPLYNKLYGPNGAGLKKILESKPHLKIKMYQGPRDIDLYGAPGGARDQLVEQANRREIGEGEQRLTERRTETGVRRTRRDSARQRGERA